MRKKEEARECFGNTKDARKPFHVQCKKVQLALKKCSSIFKKRFNLPKKCWLRKNGSSVILWNKPGFML
jgi:hypothetical protein